MANDSAARLSRATSPASKKHTPLPASSALDKGATVRPAMTAKHSNVVVMCLSLATITAYSFNSQVFKWVGDGAFTSKLFHLWLCHVGSLLLSPLLLSSGVAGVRALFAEYSRPQDAKHNNRPKLSLHANIVILACFSMEVYYFWFLAAATLPGQVLAAIFQSAIAVMYVLSVIILGEPFSWYKVSGVALAIVGVAVSSFATPDSKISKEGQVGSRGAGDLGIGIVFALVATFSNAVYKVWFKYAFGSPSPQFTLLTTVLVGAAHIFPILPILMCGHAFGFEDSRIYLDISSGSQACLLLFAVFISACVNVGSRTVIGLRSPVYWAAVQLLSIPLSVGFDFIFQGVRPCFGGLVGYAIIAAAFAVLADLVPRPVEGSTGDTKGKRKAA